MDYYDVIKQRRSVRKYKDTPIPGTVIDAIIESARLAPSGGNGQGWLFGVVTEPSLIKELAQTAGNQEWIATAPLVVALCGDVSESLRALPEDDFTLVVNRKRFTPEFIGYLREYADQRAVSLLFNNSAPMIPGEHIFLSAVNYALSACWVGFLDINKASQLLNLPEGYACLFLMPVGYKDEEPGFIERKRVEDIAFLDRFENKYHYLDKNDV